MNKHFDESDQLLENLSPASAEPDARFASELQDKFVQQATGSNNIFYLLLSNMKAIFSTRFKVAALASTLVIVALFGGMTTFLLWNNQNKLTDEEILSRIIEANASGNRAKAENIQASYISSRSAGAEDSALSIYPYWEPGYTYSRTETIYGTRIHDCYAGYQTYGLPGVVYESRNFYGEDGNYYSKSETKDLNGNTISIFVTNDQGNYEYSGGKYAVLLEGYDNVLYAEDDLAVNETEPALDPNTTYPVEEELSEVKPDINTFFGENTQVIGTEKIDGKEYYVISWEGFAYCEDLRKIEGNAVSVEKSQEQKMITKAWVDQETFEIKRSEDYLDSISENNLLVSTSNTWKHQDIELSVVKAEFDFDMNVPVKTIDVTNFEPKSTFYKTAVLDALKSSGVPVLKLNASEFTITDINPGYNRLPNANEYYQDRDFYPEGSAGDEQFRLATEYLVDYDKDTTRLYVNFSKLMSEGQQSLMGITAYEKNQYFQENWETLIGFYKSTGNKTVVKIGSASVEGEIFTPDYEKGVEPGSTGSSGKEVPPEEYISVNQEVMVGFEYQGFYYVVYAYGFVDQASALSVLNFTAIDPGTTAGYNELSSLYDQYVNYLIDTPIVPMTDYAR